MADDDSTAPGATEDTDATSTTDTDTGAQDGDGTTGTGTTTNDQTGSTTTSNGDDSAKRIAQLEKQLADARAEAGKARVNAKETAAEEARQKLTADLAKALGLVKDDKDEAPDPKALADQLAAKDRDHKAARVELAVFRAAAKHGADPEALTDSRVFLDRVGKLDPDAEDFGTKLGEAVKKAVADNPTRYKTSGGQAPPRSGGEITGGSGERQKTDEDLSVDELRKARRKARGLE